MSNLVEHGVWGADDAEADEEQLQQGKSSFFKFKVGNNYLRFFPPLAGRKSPFRVVMEHYLKIPGGKVLSFACPRYEQKLRCPVCDKADTLARTGNPRDRDAAFELYPNKRIYCNIVNLEEPEKGVQIVAIGKKIFEKLIAIRKNEDVGGNFTDPQIGFPILITRVGTSMNDTKYDAYAIVKKAGPIADMSWLEQLNDLERFARTKTYEEIVAGWTGDMPAMPAAPPSRQMSAPRPATGSGANGKPPIEARTSTKPTHEPDFSEIDDSDKLPY